MHEGASAVSVLLRRAEERKLASWPLDRLVRIFGTGNFARAVAQAMIAEGFTIDCFIQTNPTSDSFLGAPVRAWTSDVSNQDVPLVVGIFNRKTSCHEIALVARQHGYADLRFPWDVYERFGSRLGWHFWLSSRHTLLEQDVSLAKLYERMADRESRDCMLRTLAFRLGLDDDYGSFLHSGHQYFNELTLRGTADSGLVYVDGGAYSGDTLEQLIARCAVKRAYLFEPDPGNFDQLARRTAQQRWPAANLPLGLFDRHESLVFSAGLDEGSYIQSGEGNTHVTCCALDMMLPEEQVDFIKLDIEGAEVPALRGARAVIRRSRPTMAISLYHRPDDLWSIPETIEEICPGYLFYMRQYGMNTLESVLYALPG